MSIKVYYDEISFRIKGWKEIREVLEQIIDSEGKVSDDINFVLTTDEKLLKINTFYLNHNYFTDVITFNYSEEKIVRGEVYISIDTVRDNAKIYKVNLIGEIRRVMIHGIFHLLGFDDNSEEEKREMRYLEDKWLRSF